ncbi:MAG: hypothetical protein UU98_C0027G0009 [Parcubacteria group bacterium GW2011_GWD2_42_14]|nr:MAG: hypothetical protein UU98_C0027G0009 [Parcubacteria group bacterium GW2011_GWD2_42_14]
MRKTHILKTYFVGVPGIEPRSSQYQSKGWYGTRTHLYPVLNIGSCRDAGNRTRFTPTPWAHTTTVLHPDILVRGHAYILPLYYTPTKSVVNIQLPLQ